MTNKEFLIEVQKSCHLEMPLCLSLLSHLQKMLSKAAVDQVPVEMNGLGVFSSHKHPEYIKEDEETGAMTLFPPRISYRLQSEAVEGSVDASQLLAEFSKESEEATRPFIEAVVVTVLHCLDQGQEVEIPGIGTFQKIHTHQSDLNHLDYLPSEQMKELVNAPFSCFEPFVISEGKTVAPQAEEPLAEPAEEQEIEPEVLLKEETEVVPENEPVIPEAPVAPVSELQKEEPIKDQKETPKRNPKKEEESSNKLLYVSLTLIFGACGFLLWLMFGDDFHFGDDKLVEAVIVSDEKPSVATPKAPEPSVVPEEKETPKTEVEENKPVEEEKKQVVEEKKPAVEEKKPVVEEKKQVAEVKKPVETKQTVEKAPTEFHRLMGADGKPVVVTLAAGERLTLVALEHFGDKAFWPYVFDANADKLKAPNLVQAGMKLYLPDPAYYGIDAHDEASLRKAKNRAAQLLK